MSEHTHRCPECEGDGGFAYFTGTYCHQTGAADEGWDKCRLCGGTGGVPFDVWADFEHADWCDANADDPGWTPAREDAR